jgi:hypothetical protein
MSHDRLMELRVGILCLLMVGSAVAQSERGTIAGTVLDSTGAAVGGAAVTVTGEDTGGVYKTVSTGEGVYRVSDVAVGRYDVTVEVKGFKTSQQKGVLVQINTTAALNITLEPGDVKEEVTVLADAPTLQTESSDVGTVIDKRQIEELPLSLSSSSQSFLRSPETFVFLTPGTTGPGTSGSSNGNGIFTSKLSGGQNFGTEVLLDGVSIQRMDTVSAFDQIAPSVEAINEFKVTTSTPTAQFGRTSGGVESFTTKSGTNRYHGTVFDLFRNQALDAFPWSVDFQNQVIARNNAFFMASGQPDKVQRLAEKPPDHQNDFGGSLGGPVRIPHIYNGHDKTFFFFSWEQYRNNRGTTNLSTLPTDAERSGDFSALLGPDTGIPNPCTPGKDVLLGQIFDPSTTNTVLGCRMPFPGNKITNISPVAQKVLSYLPHANLSGNAQGNLNYFFSGRLPTRDTTMSFRIDENLSDKHKLFFSYSSRDQEVLNGTPALPPPLDGNFFNSNFSHLLRFGWDYIASPSVLNHLVVGFNRLWNSSTAQGVNGNNWPKVLGINNASGPTFPPIGFNGGPYGINYAGFGSNNFNQNIPSSVVLADSISWVHGRHSLRFGGEIRGLQFSVLNPATSPAYTFFNYETAYKANDQSLTGNPVASFLLGLPNQEALTISSHFPRWNQRYYALYVQDDVKLRSNLTVNVGLRWDIDTPRHEATGAMSVLDLKASNPATPGFPGALIYGNGATGAKTYFKDIGPRIGFAYSPGFMPNTVFRGGYSIYYAPLSYSDFGSQLASGTSVSPTFNSSDNFTPVQSWDVGFPAYTPPSNNNSPTLVNFSDSGNTVLPSYSRPGMVQNWTLEVQHQIAQDLIFTLGYVGQHGTRLHSNLAQVNTINPKYNFLGNQLNFLVDGTDGNNGPAILAQLGVSVPSWFVAGWGDGSGGRARIGQLLRPFPQFGTIGTNCCLENLGQSTYNALEAKVERRFRNGLNLLAAYTFSKTLTDSDSNYAVPFSAFGSNVFGAQNPYNLRAEKAVSYQDIPQTFVLSYLYELPAGPGKRYLNHGVASKVLGGWQIGGVQRYQSGSPTTISAGATSPANIYGGNWRYSLIPGQSLFLSNPSHWTPALDGFFNSAGPNSVGFQSGCTENSNGTFSFSSNSNSPILNCAALLDPSKIVGSVPGAPYVFGNLPPVEGWLRSPGYVNEDFAIIKRTQIRESSSIVFKLDIPNAFNRHVFSSLSGSPGDSFFGVPGGGGHGVLNGSRQIQATLRYEF